MRRNQPVTGMHEKRKRAASASALVVMNANFFIIQSHRIIKPTLFARAHINSPSRVYRARRLSPCANKSMRFLFPLSLLYASFISRNVIFIFNISLLAQVTFWSLYIKLRNASRNLLDRGARGKLFLI